MTLLSRIQIVERHVPGGALDKCYDVLLDGKCVGSRFARPTIAEAEDIARASLAPAVALMEFDRNDARHKRPAGRISNAEKAERERYREEE